MASLGQRLGLRPVREVLQTDSLDDQTRIKLWNRIHGGIMGVYEISGNTKAAPLMQRVWDTVLHRPRDEYAWNRTEAALKARILSDEWLECLEAVEEFGEALRVVINGKFAAQFREVVNDIFEEELVGYRFVGDELVLVDDAQSALEIETAIATATDAARAHLQNALALLSDRRDPQYAKVASESVMAVEAAVHNLTGQKTLGDGVKELGKRGLPVHPAILKAWSAMYGYTSDAGGIRHANISGEEVDAAMAVYLLVTCSAFVNLLSKVASAPVE